MFTPAPPAYATPLLSVPSLELPDPYFSSDDTQSAPASEETVWAVLIDASATEHVPPLDQFADDLSCYYDQLHVLAGIETKIRIADLKEGAETKKAMIDSVLTSLAARVGPKDIILVYFQGYAFHLNGVDYLVPTDGDPKDVAEGVQNPQLTSLDSMVRLSDVCDSIGQCEGRGLIILNPYATNPPDFAEVSIEESYPITPFGEEACDLPDDTILVISRSLDLMPPRHRLLETGDDHPQTTVFTRIVLESLSGLAIPPDAEETAMPGVSLERVTIGHFNRYLLQRAEIRDFKIPELRQGECAPSVRLLPYFDAPLIVQQLQATAALQIQRNLFEVGTLLLFDFHDPENAANAMENCLRMDQESVTTEEAIRMQGLADIANGSWTNLQRRLEENGGSIPAYVWRQVAILGDPSEAAAMEEEQATLTTASRSRIPSVQPGDYIAIDDIRRDANQRVWLHITEATHLVVETPYKLDENGQRVVENNRYVRDRIESMQPRLAEDGETALSGWIDAESLNLVAFRTGRDDSWRQTAEEFRTNHERWFVGRKAPTDGYWPLRASSVPRNTPTEAQRRAEEAAAAREAAAAEAAAAREAAEEAGETAPEQLNPAPSTTQPGTAPARPSTGRRRIFE